MNFRPGYFVMEALASLRRTGAVAGVAVLSLWLAAFSFGLWMMMKKNSSFWLEMAGERFSAVAYFADGRGEAGARQAFEALKLLPGVKESRLVSPEEAAKELSGDAKVSEWLQALGGENPLPWTGRFRLAEAKPEAFRAFAAEARKIEGVADIDFGGDATETLLAWLKLLRDGLLMAALAFAACAALLTGGVIRLTLYARRGEIAIMRMVGASPAFIRFPLLLEGALQGLLGGLAACLSLHFARGAALSQARELLAVDLQAFFPHGMDFSLWAGVLGAGAGLGLLGSLLALGGAMKDRP